MDFANNVANNVAANVSKNISSEDFPVIGSVIMLVIFIYAWVMDASERKEAFMDMNDVEDDEQKRKTPVVVESFYGGPPPVQQMNRAYAL
jgi:hypothetical protein